MGQLYGSTYSRPQSGYSRVENAAVGLADAITAYRVKAAAYEPDISTARDVIAQVENPRYRRLLTLRYVNAKSWEEIAALMSYPVKDSMFKAHGRALGAAGKVLQKLDLSS